MRLIVPYAAGSGTDATARALAVGWPTLAGQTVVVENLPGASGMTGTLRLVKAPKDGDVLGLVSSNHVVNPAFFPKMPFDAVKDVTVISIVGTVPLALIVAGNSPWKNLDQLVADAKRNPGTLTYGGSLGSAIHIAGAIFARQSGIDVRLIPYNGSGPLLTDLVGGRIQYALIGVSAVAGLIEAGKVRALAVTTSQRAQILPEIPTMLQQGVQMDYGAWLALIGPAGIAPSVVAKRYSELQGILQMAPVKEAMRIQGMTTIASSPDRASQFVQTELARHLALVKSASLNLNQ